MVELIIAFLIVSAVAMAYCLGREHERNRIFGKTSKITNDAISIAKARKEKGNG